MPTPSIPKPIKITVTSGIKGQPITIVNRTTGERKYDVLGKTAGHLFDLQNFINGYTTGDVIDFMISGTIIGSNSLTTTADTVGPQSVTISTSTASTVARGI